MDVTIFPKKNDGWRNSCCCCWVLHIFAWSDVETASSSSSGTRLRRPSDTRRTLGGFSRGCRWVSHKIVKLKRECLCVVFEANVDDVTWKSSYFTEIKPGQVLHFIGIFMFLASFVGVLHEVAAKTDRMKIWWTKVSLMTILSSKHRKTGKEQLFESSQLPLWVLSK